MVLYVRMYYVHTLMFSFCSSKTECSTKIPGMKRTKAKRPVEALTHLKVMFLHEIEKEFLSYNNALLHQNQLNFTNVLSTLSDFSHFFL